MAIAYNDVITMISGFRRPLSVPPTTPAYRERLTLIIDFYHLLSGFFSSEAFDKADVNCSM